MINVYIDFLDFFGYNNVINSISPSSENISFLKTLRDTPCKIVFLAPYIERLKIHKYMGEYKIYDEIRFDSNEIYVDDYSIFVQIKNSYFAKLFTSHDKYIIIYDNKIQFFEEFNTYYQFIMRYKL